MRVLVFVTFYYAMFGYPWLRLLDQLAPHLALHGLTILAFLVGPAALWMLSRRLASPRRYWIARLVYVWLGASWLLLSLSLLWELIYLALPLHQNTSALVLIGVHLVLVSYACVNANRFDIRTVRLRSNKLTSPLRILQLSDVHVGSRSPIFLARVVAAAQACKADLILITGDLIDGHGVKQSELAALGQLAPHCYFAIGNHERYVDCDEICARLTALGVHVLRNATTPIQVNGNEITLLGIDDADDPQQVAQVLPSLTHSASDYSILLYHRPDGLEDAASHDIDLMLCGHTHNGQMVPFNFLVKRRFPRIRGLYWHINTALYVSAGTGTWGPPMRLGSVNELTILELEPA
jgi:uncharacterized protein